MKNLRSRFERFCFRNRDKGIPNLMLYITLGTAIVYLYTITTKDLLLFEIFSFDPALILKGQVWRLFTFVFLRFDPNILTMLIMLVCYYSLGRAMENVWGTLRFNLYYLTGILMMDIFCLVFNCYADAYYLNLSLFLSYATLYPSAQFLLMFIIPIKAWVLALFYFVMLIIGVFSLPLDITNLFPLVALANYFLFFGKDIVNVFPLSWQANARRFFRKKKPASQQPAKPIPFNSAGSYQATHARVKAPYQHRCTICGRTDISNPELEFRYCSKCQGYYCYCQDHIGNHVHITEE